jgi:hypothetical protein
MTRLPALRRLPGLLLVAAIIGRAGDVRAGNDPPAHSPTPEERQAAAALDAVGATLRINGQFQIVSVSLLNDDAVTNEILAHVGRLKNLQSLSVTGLKITDEALQQFAGLKRLTTLTLRDVAATDEGIARLQEALPDCRIRRSTSRVGIRGVPDAIGERRAVADAALLAERRAVAERARQRPLFQFGPVAGNPRSHDQDYSPTQLMRELFKPDVHIEIELTAQQWDALRSMHVDGVAASEGVAQKIRDLEQQSDVEEQNQLREQVRAELEQLHAAADERIKALLSAEQFHRLQQLTWHTRGSRVLLDPAFTADLGLDEAQQSRIEALCEGTISELEPRTGPDARANPVRVPGPTTGEWPANLMAVLTARQRTACEQKLGPPPETDVERIGQHVFALLDANGNEELSEEEWGSADTARLLSLPRSRVHTTLPLGRAEFVRLFVKMREQPRGSVAPDF